MRAIIFAAALVLVNNVAEAAEYFLILDDHGYTQGWPEG